MSSQTILISITIGITLLYLLVTTLKTIHVLKQPESIYPEWRNKKL